MQTLPCPIAKSSLLYPNHIAIETATLFLSYQEIEKKIQSLQVYIKSLTLSSRNIGLIAFPSINTILLYFAAIREELSVCMLNPKDPPNLLEEKIQELSLIILEAPDTLSAASSFPMNTSISAAHLSTYLYTSGSSSKPKIAALSFQNHYYSALGILETLQITPSSRLLLSLPLHHVSGLSILFRTFLSGATLVISSSSDLTTALLISKNISHLSLVSTQYIRLLKIFDKTLLTNLKAILLGGGPFPAILLKEGILKNIPLYLSYGLTEMSSAVCCNPLLKTNNINSCGYLLPYRKLKINKNGEILVSGKAFFKGYYSIEKKAVISKKGWFKTKDLGCFSLKDGLFFQGRKDRLVISGGENIQPEEIERLLLSIEDVYQAIIISLPDMEFGQKIIAIIRKNPLLCFNDISKELSKHLPKYKLPKGYLPWPKELEPTSLKISSSLKEALFKYAVSHISFSSNMMNS